MGSIGNKSREVQVRMTDTIFHILVLDAEQGLISRLVEAQFYLDYAGCELIGLEAFVYIGGLQSPSLGIDKAIGDGGGHIYSGAEGDVVAGEYQFVRTQVKFQVVQYTAISFAAEADLFVLAEDGNFKCVDHF